MVMTAVKLNEPVRVQKARMLDFFCECVMQSLLYGSGYIWD